MAPHIRLVRTPALIGFGRWLVGDDGHALFGRSRTTTDGAYKLSLSGGYGLFRVS
jgi:hypothetical protein